MSKQNYLLHKVLSLFETKEKGTVLDLGCGGGQLSKALSDMGFDVCAADMDAERFEYSHEVKFAELDLNNRLQFKDGQFDYVIFMEVIEHVYNPDFIIGEISRILKPNGMLVISTPNILNIGSRLRFLFEGAYDFFGNHFLSIHEAFPQRFRICMLFLGDTMSLNTYYLRTQ